MGCYSFTFVNTTKHTEKLWNEVIYVKLTVIIMFSKPHRTEMAKLIQPVILLQEKFLQFDWLRAVVFQLNLKYLHVKITNLLRVVI